MNNLSKQLDLLEAKHYLNMRDTCKHEYIMAESINFDLDEVVYYLACRKCGKEKL